MRKPVIDFVEVVDAFGAFVRVLLLGRKNVPLWAIPLKVRLMAASNAIHER